MDKWNRSCFYSRGGSSFWSSLVLVSLASVDTEEMTTIQSIILALVDKLVTVEMNAELLKPITPEKVLLAIKSQPYDNALGPDVVGARFYWELREVLQSELFNTTDMALVRLGYEGWT